MDPPDKTALLRRYFRTCKLKGNSHKYAEQYYQRMYRLSGAVPIVIGAISTVLSSLASSGKTEDISIPVVVSCATATLSSTLHQYLALAEKVNHHNTASTNFTDIASDIEFFLNQADIDETELLAFSEGIHERMDIFEGQEPLLKECFVTKAKKDAGISSYARKLTTKAHKRTMTMVEI